MCIDSKDKQYNQGFLLVEAVLMAAVVSISLIPILGLFRQIVFVSSKTRAVFELTNASVSQAAYVCALYDAQHFVDPKNLELDYAGFYIDCDDIEEDEEDFISIECVLKKRHAHLKEKVNCTFFVPEEDNLGLR